jgi:hypothetical protein
MVSARTTAKIMEGTMIVQRPKMLALAVLLMPGLAAAQELPVTKSPATTATAKPPSKMTLAQAEGWVKANPEFTTGFKTQEGVTVKSAKAGSNGLSFTYEAPGNYSGRFTVNGPPHTVTPEYVASIGSVLKKIAEYILGGGAKGGGTSTTTTTTNNNQCVNIIINSGGGTVINGQSCGGT